MKIYENYEILMLDQQSMTLLNILPLFVNILYFFYKHAFFF